MLSSIENRNHSGRDASLNSKASDHCCSGTTSYSQHKHFYEAKKKNIYASSSTSSSQEENKQTYRNKAYTPRAQSLVDIRNYLENLSYLLEQEETSHHDGRKLDLSKIMELADEVKSPPKRRRRRRKPKSKVEMKDQKQDQEEESEEKVELVVVQSTNFMVKVQELFSIDSQEIELILY
ncbi:predicted protein [Chaetoceros tenuissimus]|uniref:Uncharacterized protein n=1 Tax=Chaetoceros tenuissimus TaxID=426638 RepID=A0AAD3CHH1_9STRA|nr:predicted protein [Chaetoceros tenuissimus]